MPEIIVALGLSLTDWGQLVGLGILIVGFVVAGRAKSKDATIRNREDENESLRALLETRDLQLRGAQDRANREHEIRIECDKQVSRLEGEVATLNRYTAQAALEDVGKRMTMLQTAIETAIGSQNELTLQTHSILEGVQKTLESNGRIIQRLLDIEEKESQS